MKIVTVILLLLTLFVEMMDGYAQSTPETTYRFSGQASAWCHFNPTNDHQLYLGGRYMPQLNIEHTFQNGHLFDVEASANIVGDLGTIPFDSMTTNGQIKPYRLWMRYSNNQFEARVGLQKINFGSAQIIRPLMWFDQVDPRDPLQMTDGVWGGLGRYYFLNNANVWFWALYGNNETKGWEWAPTSKETIELGGRIQMPLSLGEVGLSYHHRKANVQDLSQLLDFIPELAEVPEHRLALDVRMDVVVGFWLEATWTHMKSELLGPMQNQALVNLGVDYTFGIGNGLACTAEHILMSADEDPFAMENSTQFSAMMASYPIGMFDNVSAILYMDWESDSFYTFVNWQHDFSAITLYSMAYWNPSTYAVPTPGATTNLYGNVGLQLMVVFNH